MIDIAITGIGILSSIGNYVLPGQFADGKSFPQPLEHKPFVESEFTHALREGKSGAATLDPTLSVDWKRYGHKVTIGCEVKDFDPREHFDSKQVNKVERVSLMARTAAAMAVHDSGINFLQLSREEQYRAGAILGTGIGGIAVNEALREVIAEKGARAVDGLAVTNTMPNAQAAYLTIDHMLRGCSLTTNTACASALHAMGVAIDKIRAGRLEIVLSGGAESSITPVSLASFIKMRAVTTKYNDNPTAASRPFDSDRDGFVIAEGAAVYVLETLDRAKARGARIYALVRGYGETSDAYHITAPEPTGEGSSMAMRFALADAEISPEEVNYINAHGTSTPYNDRTESAAIKAVFGDQLAHQIPVSSTKSMHGHALGAAGAIETAAIIAAMQGEFLPPTINYTTPDPDCDLDYVPNKARKARIHIALNNSLGFGGHNACIVLENPNVLKGSW